MTAKNDERYIKTILESGNISEAASHLGITQPALSVYIRRLESRLGISLFRKDSTLPELTESGQIYLKYLEKENTLWKSFSQEIIDTNNGIRGSLTIGGSACFNGLYLSHAVTAFHKKCPLVKIHIITGTVPEIMKKTKTGEIDLFLSPYSYKEDGFQSDTLFSERIMLCLPIEWELNDVYRSLRIPEIAIKKGATKTQYPKFPFSELYGKPFISLNKDQYIGQLANELFSRAGIQNESGLEVDQMITTLVLTMHGLGASLITETAIRHSMYDQYPACYAIDEDLSFRKMFMVRSNNNYCSKACNVFIQTLQEIFTETEKNKNEI